MLSRTSGGSTGFTPVSPEAQNGEGGSHSGNYFLVQQAMVSRPSWHSQEFHGPITPLFASSLKVLSGLGLRGSQGSPTGTSLLFWISFLGLDQIPTSLSQ